jgi:phosphotriesterase-related protein
MAVMTVLGLVEADSLGITLMHEHLFHNVGGELLDDEVLLVEELNEYRQTGGQTVVDLTTLGIDPSPSALSRIAQKTGLHIVAGTGYYIEDLLPGEVRVLNEEALYAGMIRDLTTGFPGTGVRAGIIGEIGCGTLNGSDITPFEERALRAAARAQQETGAAINVHTQIDRGPQGLWALNILQEAGSDLTRVVLAHCDARIDLPYCREVFARGALVEYSAVGRNRHTAALSDGTPVPDTEARVSAIARLVAEGYALQLLLSHDVCARAHLRRYGGGGFTYLTTHIVPMLLAAGVSEEAIQTMLIDNPARLLNRRN